MKANAWLIGIFFILAFVTGSVSYWMFQPVVPRAEVVSDKMIDEDGSETESFIAGKPAYIRRTINRLPIGNGDVFKVTRMLVRAENDEIVHRWSSVPAPPPLGVSTRVIRIEIPPHIQSGKYKVRTLIHFHLNPLRNVHFELLPSPEFYVHRESVR